jgi:hypothetical protein
VYVCLFVCFESDNFQARSILFLQQLTMIQKLRITVAK